MVAMGLVLEAACNRCASGISAQGRFAQAVSFYIDHAALLFEAWTHRWLGDGLAWLTIKV